jgi:hypothetical protein
MPAKRFSLANRKSACVSGISYTSNAYHKVSGSVVCIEFLKEDDTPRYKRPLWLFWTGPEDVSPQDLCKMYLWRFAIEHLFRFLKQHLGLNTHRSSNLESLKHWMDRCHRLLAVVDHTCTARNAGVRDTVQPNCPAFIRKQNRDKVDSGKRDFKIKSKTGQPVIPKTTWTKTILAVRTENAAVYCANVTKWAKSVLGDVERLKL